jgi:hypothetical protein
MTGHEYTIDLPGSVGSINDDTPLIMPAQVRPYAVAMLLHCGWITEWSLVAAISPGCNTEDLKVGAWDPLTQDYCDGTRLELLVTGVIAEFKDLGLIEFDSSLGRYYLTDNDLTKVISWVATLNAQLPASLNRRIAERQNKDIFKN